MPTEKKTKSTSAKAIPHIPLPFEELITDVLKVKPEQKPPKKPKKRSRGRKHYQEI